MHDFNINSGRHYGVVRTANACTHPDLFWAIRGGGGNFGVVVSFLFAPFLEGLVDGFRGAARQQDWPVESVGLLAILAFFTGFHFKWLRGLR